MATTAEPQPTSTRRQRPADHRQGLGHRCARPAASTDGVRAPRAPARRCRDQDHLRRHLPLATCTPRATTGAARVYPVIPGHEIVGTVTAIGNEVTRHRVGDTVAVGCMVDSCMECDQCLEGWEVFCRKGCVQTYNSADYHDGTITKGGYTDHIVVRDHFVLKVPEGMDVSRVAPLLCAGITTYSPLRQYDVGPGTKMAVVGLGGLGHMGVKLGAALGAHVTMITTTPSKGEDARELGAHDVIISTDPEQMEAAATRFDFILNTIPVSHEIDGYLQLLGRSGRMVIVGALIADAGLRRRQPHLVEPRGRRIGDRRHSRDSGNARFLRRQGHLPGCRVHRR